MELTEAELAGSDSSDELSADEAGPLEAAEDELSDDGGAPRKKARTALRRPPTADELISLRQTQNLFHSNLFQLQTTEMLSEVTPTAKQSSALRAWITEFEAWLAALYARKRALYLTYLAWRLRGCQLVACVEFALVDGDPAARELAQLPAACQAVRLLAVWLRQRQLDQGPGAVDAELLTAFILWLFKQRRLAKLMSAYQVMRNVWVQLTKTDWAAEGVSFVDNPADGQPALHEFTECFEVVLVEPSGFLNLAWAVSGATYARLRDEAARAVAYLDDPEVDGFQALFMTPVPFLEALDHVWHVQTSALTRQQPATVVDKGPDSERRAEAAEFRAFWGTPAGTRRFQDGSIREAVVWRAETLHEHRMICRQVVLHLLRHHFKVSESEVRYVSDGPEELLCQTRQLPAFAYGSGEEAELALSASFGRLSALLRRMHALPLSVAAVHAAAPALRHAEPFPPLPEMYQALSGRSVRHGASQLLERQVELPLPWAPVSDVVLQLEISGKWPEEPDAIRRVKAAFHLQMRTELTSQGLTAAVRRDGVLVICDGFLFRLAVAYPREPALLRLRKQPEAAALLLAGLQRQHPAYSASCRLALRWLSAQMLSELVPDIAAELLMAQKLAAAAHQLLSAQLDATPDSATPDWRAIFRPPLDTFDMRCCPAPA
ncbi:nucleolar protein 6-like [Pollicipes pollicipes]|uniref:nucleolar protein 6-like n=1 Tax=Pollicipes pollicipes TaxID=41117 RepID=UPI00188565B0|nr:nucleolar protein 6-like [Pollicipes pollicipes]